MPRIYDVYLEAMNRGKEIGVLSADLRILIAHNEGFAQPIDTIFHKDEPMKDPDLFWRQFDRLAKGEPVEYIIHEAQFLQHKLYVDENVLIPRMETAEMVAKITEKIWEYYDPRNYLVVADIGTGSGAISIALKQQFKNWMITASDISERALEVARKNIEHYGMNIRTAYGRSLEPYIQQGMYLDIIVSNPPYITSEEETQDSVKNYEPASALWLDKDHSTYEEIFKDYRKVKKGTMLMVFEIGYDLRPYLTELMAKYLENYEYEFVKDLNELDRFLFVYLK